MTQLTSDAVLQQAYAWLGRARRDWPDTADVWDLRRYWTREQAHLRQNLVAGTYQLGLLACVTRRRHKESNLSPLRPFAILGDSA